VEGEIGRVGKADESSIEAGAVSALTDPVVAVEYARRTGVDILAVSIGNKHGFYQGEPKLDFELLAEIHRTVSIPLVMHGGTGIPKEDIQRSIGLGIAKVNVASELVHGLRGSLTAQWAQGINLWSPLAVAEARKIMEPVVEKWIRITGAAGKA
jgi:fructose/tagatose bisphosphate aldolase